MIIKVRAKDYNDNWVYGEPHLLTTDKPHLHTFDNPSLKIPIQKETICCFTNTYAEDGREIYEGDIIEYGKNKTRYVIIFTDGMFYGSVEYCNLNVYGGYPIHFFTENAEDRKCNVIGNIYDNPKLIVNQKYKT